MAMLKAAFDSLNGVKPLNGRAGGGAALVNGFDVPSNLKEFVHSDKFLTLAVDPEGMVTPEINMAKMAFHAKRMAPERDGIRRSRAVWVSNSQERSEELEKTFLEALPDSSRDNVIGRTHTYTAHFDRDVECEILFRVYNKHEDVSSMPHASFYIFDNLLGVNSEVFRMSGSRVGLYPNKVNGPGCFTEDGKTNNIVWGATSTLNGDAPYWNDLIANNDGFLHLARLS